MKLPFTVQIDKETRASFEAVAEGAHMEPTKYAAVWIGLLSQVKPEHAFDALAAIKPEWKKRRPGRPPSTTGKTDTVAAAEVSAQHVA